MMQKTVRRSYQGPEDEQPTTIYHIWREEIPIPTAEGPEPEPGNLYPIMGTVLICLLILLCIGIPYFTLEWLPQVYPNTYDATISRTLVLQLGSQVPLITLPAIRKSESMTVQATGTFHQPAQRAVGLITFYNGLFTGQNIPAGTRIGGRDGVIVLTLQSAIVPAASATTPPTDGTVSVPAEAEAAGSAGNIAAQDIDTVCCNGAILAQNLDAFSGGQDAQVVQVLTQGDLAGGKQRLSELVNRDVNGQVEREEKPGDILLPLLCERTSTANHRAGDQAASAAISLVAVCNPLAYFAPDIAHVAQQLLAIPKDYHLVSFSAFVFASHITSQGGTLTVRAIAYLKRNVVAVNAYRFAGK